jgi:hypothetical protein
MNGGLLGESNRSWVGCLSLSFLALNFNISSKTILLLKTAKVKPFGPVL